MAGRVNVRVSYCHAISTDGPPADTPIDTLSQIELCRQVVAWCNAQKRTFLRQRIESRLAALLFEQVGETFACSGRMCVVVVVRDGSIGRQLLMSHHVYPRSPHRITQGDYSEALNLVNKLLRELKKFDDKQLLVRHPAHDG